MANDMYECCDQALQALHAVWLELKGRLGTKDQDSFREKFSIIKDVERLGPDSVWDRCLEYPD